MAKGKAEWDKKIFKKAEELAEKKKAEKTAAKNKSGKLFLL